MTVRQLKYGLMLAADLRAIANCEVPGGVIPVRADIRDVSAAWLKISKRR